MYVIMHIYMNACMYTGLARIYSDLSFAKDVNCAVRYVATGLFFIKYCICQRVIISTTDVGKNDIMVW